VLENARIPTSRAHDVLGGGANNYLSNSVLMSAEQRESGLIPCGILTMGALFSISESCLLMLLAICLASLLNGGHCSIISI
jgi:hypothetical protein